jgi:hypothetical protein
MNRLTERDEYGNADIIGVDSEDIQLNLDFEGFNRVTEALNRLAAYEDTGLDPEEIKRSDDLLRGFIDLSRRHARTLHWTEKVMIADREGRLTVLPRGDDVTPIKCTGLNCPMQAGKVDPATCKAADTCEWATKPMTNADRIRAMTDEEMAQWLTFIEEKILAKQLSISRSEMFADWFDWLKQEVKDGH